MILEAPATVKLLGALVEAGQRGATRELLQQKTGIGKTTFYRVLKPLLARGVIREKGSLYRMPLDHPYNFLFKRLHAIEKVEELPQLVRDRVLSVVDHAKAHLSGHLLALWLVGSAAHQTMTEDSDLDFLAVLDQEIEYFPSLTYAVHFVTMTEEEFRERWREKNDFILTSLRHGLLLEDRGFAQEFYLEPLPVQLKGQEFHLDAQELEEQKERFMLSLKARLPEEAAKSLAHYAISISRRMLRVYNILPAGKPELLKAVELLFGSGFRRKLELIIHRGRPETSKHWAVDLMERFHQLEEDYLRFSSHLAHFQKYATLATSSGDRYEELAVQALQEISGVLLENSSDADGLLKWRRQGYLIEIKSSKGPFTEASLQQAVRHLASATQEERASRALVIANPYRSIPLLERPPAFSQETRNQANSLGIELRSTIELLSALNRSILEAPQHSIFDHFLGSLGNAKKNPVGRAEAKKKAPSKKKAAT